MVGQWPLWAKKIRYGNGRSPGIFGFKIRKIFGVMARVVGPVTWGVKQVEKFSPGLMEV
jgi:hypothetical protein